MKKVTVKTNVTRQGLTRSPVARKNLPISHTISFQEKTPRGMIDKSFDCPKEHVDWHLTQLKKMLNVPAGCGYLCQNIRVETKKG